MSFLFPALLLVVMRRRHEVILMWCQKSVFLYADENMRNVQKERAEEATEAARHAYEELKKAMDMRSLKLSLGKKK